MTEIRTKSSVIQDFILNNIKPNGKNIVNTVVQEFNISRQAVNRHIGRLVKEGLLEAIGSTRNREYRLKELENKTIEIPLSSDLEEDVIWRLEIMPLLSDVPENVRRICEYGTTEMINNAIDHSEGTILKVNITMTAKDISIIVNDNGVGIFNKICKAFNLENERHAILELSKGKLTTDPKRHTGEGIFFTSRIFDRFGILSDKLNFIHYRDADWLIEDQSSRNPASGTSIVMVIGVDVRHTSSEIFEKYSTEDGVDFSKTHVPVFLATYGEENLVSRSQARRLLARFDRFKEVFLDFSGVKIIGQAFADEIFRVFRTANPDINLIYTNVNDDVRKMIQRAMVR